MDTNNGTATTSSAAITNDLATNFHDGRVRFLMQNAAMGYKVTNGQILAQYAYNIGVALSGFYRIVVVP